MSDSFGLASRSLHIGFYLWQFPVTSQTFIQRQIASLLDRGHRVTVLSERHPEGFVRHETLARYNLVGHTKYMSSIGSGDKNGSLKDICRVFRSAVLRPLTAVSIFRSDAIVRRKLFLAANAAETFRFDAVLAHFGPTAINASECVSLGIIDAPLFPVFHGYDLTRHPQKHGKDCYMELFTRSAACLAISDRWRQRLVEMGCPHEKALVHRVGLDVGLIPYQPRTQPAGELKLLSVARLVEKKGIEHAIRAISELNGSVRVHYSVVGDGPLLHDLERLVSHLGLTGTVSFLGPKSEQEVGSLMKQSDVLLVPSVVAADGDEEGIPVVIMEAMASGLPVVASRHSGIPELVLDGLTGTLVEEANSQDLADAIIRASRGPDAFILAAARKRVGEMHSGNALAEDLETIVRKYGTTAHGSLRHG